MESTTLVMGPFMKENSTGKENFAVTAFFTTRMGVFVIQVDGSTIPSMDSVCLIMRLSPTISNLQTTRTLT